MENLGLNKIRELFLSFYESKDHFRRKSFSLIPQNDKSLLIINSGMAPLKPYFSGQETPPAPRMTTCQKCIRTADLENVGHTSRHGTFFEMMGSFSFGDYFKKESLTWGWEFITEVLKMPTDRLWATVYEDDDEAYDIWKNIIGMPEEKIVRLGKDDNFWEIGTGPCGPCSEIYYDRGEQYGCGSPDCRPGCECDRYIEFWNHVFTQYDNKGDGTYTDLEKKNIDTGLGLERIACIMQDVDSIFAVDTIKYVLDAVCEVSGVKYENGTGENDISIRIITDHVRSATFMIGDHIMPGNEGRGYVLKRIIRRAVRHGRKMGIQGTFLADLSGKVVDTCSGAYPELEEQRLFINKVIRKEEEKFSETLQQGMDLIEKYISSADGKALSGEAAFKLYDTYGFPYEITEEICREKGFAVDKAGFEQCMSEQKEAGKEDAARKDFAWKDEGLNKIFTGKTEFTGYDTATDSGTVKTIYMKDKAVKSLKNGESGNVILDRTPFYAESGGQAADIGLIYGDDSAAEVTDVQKYHDVFTHEVRMRKGELSVGDKVETLVSEPNRNRTSRNHTATHLLHKALREILGDHVQQAGSQVTSETLRFDFNHYEPMTDEQIKSVEKIVNDKIDFFLPVRTDVMAAKDAGATGAIGLFEEKYGDVVRVVSVGDYSKELCGGVHVKNSGQIGSFRIISETGVASGVRRIEAVTGTNVLNRLAEKEALIEAADTALKTTADQLEKKAAAVMTENAELRKQIEKFTQKALGTVSDKLIEDSKEVNGIRLVTRLFKDYSIDDLRKISDDVKANNDNVAMVLAAQNGDKITFLVSLTDDVVAGGHHAGKMIREIAAAAGGGGGGKANMAQAGAKDPAKVKDAFKVAEKLL